MARLYNTFEFTGELAFPKEPTVINDMGTSGWKKKQQSLIIKESNSNSAFVKMEAIFHPNKESQVFTSQKGLFGEKSENVKIDWDDRLKDSIVDSVPDYRKTVIDLTPPDVDKNEYFNNRREIYNLENKENPTQADKTKLAELYDKVRELLPERKEFLHKFDAIDYLSDKLEGLKGKKFRVKGNIVKSYYNGTFYTTYEPQSIELVSDEYTNSLSLQLDLFYKKDAVDDKSFKKNGMLYFDTYIIAYDNQHKKDVFFPQKTVFNGSKLDMENERHAALVKFFKDTFTVSKSKEVNHIAVEAKVVNGAEAVEFNESHLTAKQKDMILLGLAELNDFKPRGTVLGENVDEIRIIKPLLKEFNTTNNFKLGAVVSTFSPEQLVYVPLESQSKPKEDTTTQTTQPETTADIGDVFEDDDLLGLLD